MPRITAIQPTKRDPMRAMVRVDGKVFATLNRHAIDELGLAKGDEWNDELAARTLAAAGVDKAYRDALRRLNRRSMSRGMLERKLRQKDHDPGAIAAALDRLEDLKLIDDVSFGRMLIRDLQMRKPAGPRLITSKLYEKGLKRDLIERLIAEAFADADDDQLEGATELARKKLRTLERFDEQTRKRRLYGMLARRGFTGDIVSKAISAVMKEDD